MPIAVRVVNDQEFRGLGEGGRRKFATNPANFRSPRPGAAAQ